MKYRYIWLSTVVLCLCFFCGDNVFACSNDFKFYSGLEVVIDEDMDGNMNENMDENMDEEGIYADVNAPEAVITVTPSQCSWGKGIYGSADTLSVQIRVWEESLAMSSGLQKIECQIADLETNYVELVKSVSYERTDCVKSWTGACDINKAVFTSNRVSVIVTAKDWAGNTQTVQSEEISIDYFSPKVKMSMSMSDAVHGKYFRTEKVLMISVSEKNFDPSYLPAVYSQNDRGYTFSGWQIADGIARGTITFEADGKYRVEYQCCDLAGNASEKVIMEEIIIDKTSPVCTIRYDNNHAVNGIYYSAQRTATMIIKEQNFNFNDVILLIKKDNKVLSDVNPEWYSDGDSHSAKVFFKEDGEYVFSVGYTDLAGNLMNTIDVSKFIIDRTCPKVKVEGVIDDASYNKEIAPAITLTDTNLNMENTQIELTGLYRGTIDIGDISDTISLSDGIKIVFKNFPKSMDDLYTLNIISVDSAGNETKKSCVFTVNREGTLYSVDDSAKEVLDAYYINQVRDIVIYAENLDRITSHSLTYSADDEIIKLNEVSDYELCFEQTAKGKYRYTYKIKASCFAEDGMYSVNIRTADAAGNESSNVAKGTKIGFVLDRTPPSLIVSNMDSKGRYKADMHEFTVNIKDNTKLAFMDLYIDDQLIKRYSADEILETEGMINIIVGKSNRYQNIWLTARDSAGNIAESAHFRVLITQNRWIQMFTDDVFWVVCTCSIILGIGLIFLLKNKKKHMVIK